MKFGIALVTEPKSVDVVTRAEDLGFHRVWFYDSQLLCSDPFVVMALCAKATRTIRLATGVLIPSNRIAPVAANAFATLNALAPGRIDCGVGTGFTARRTMALGAMKLSDMVEYVRVMRALWSGKTVSASVEGREPRKLRFINQPPRFAYFDVEHPISVHISAFAPKGRRLTAEVADGWIDFIFGAEGAIADLRKVDGDCKAIGRDPNSLWKTGFTLGCVLEDGEAYDSPRARAQAGPQAIVILHNAVESEERGSPLALPPALQPALQAYRTIYQSFPRDERHLLLHEGHLTHVRPEEEAFLNGEFLRAVTMTGTRSEIRDRIATLDAGGFHEIAIQLVPGQEDALEQWAEVLGTRG
jgi:5,10-methylenetetrahydromethanopterin reductase